MNQLVKQSTLLLLKVFILCVISVHVKAQQLPPVQNVQLNGDQITWDAVEGATGYNVYFQGNYETTLRGDLQYTATETGSYGITAFDDAGNFSPRRGSNAVFFEGGVDNRPFVIEVGEGVAYITQRCFDVGAGDTCVARCGGVINGFLVGSATGGSCSSSDGTNINSLISFKEYACTVSVFTSRVESKVACLVLE